MPLLSRGYSHTIPYCDIRLDEDVIVLRGSPAESAGALLRGRLAFCLRESVAVRSITLNLVGLKRLHWQERASTVTGMTLKSVKHEEVVYEKTWQFLEFDHKHPVTLRPDNYEYGFDVILPGDLPESIEGLEDAHIIYRMKATIDRPRFAQNVVTKKHLRIVRTLNAGALELAQTMSVENLWPNKVEYSISIPTKAVVFGSAIPIDIVLMPLLKGLTIGKVTCSLKELHSFQIQERSSKNDMRNILTQTFESGKLDEEDGEDLGRWSLHERLELPRSLARCVQDCEVESIKVRHKLKFTIQLHNPDGHTSELRASLPVMLFISPNFLMDDDNVIHGNSSSSDSIHDTYAPPRYDDHYLDRLYEDIPHDHFETPLPSGANTPMLLSRNNSSENLAMLSLDGRTSGHATPLRIPDANSGRWSANMSRVATPAISSPPRGGAGFTDDELMTTLANGDYFSRNGGAASVHSRSGPSTRAHSPEGSHHDDEALHLSVLSKVPSYSTAVRTGIRNLDTSNSLPKYEESDVTPPSQSAPVTPRHSPTISHALPVDPRARATRRSNTLGGMSTTSIPSIEVGDRRSTDLSGPSHRSSDGLFDFERRIRLLQLRSR
ncbi:hypothetical protein RUND412_003556 [Rhizina undulata]